VVPAFADQFENGRRVVARGAGLMVATDDPGRDGTRTLVTEADAPRIAAAIEAVRADDSTRRAAAEVAAEMAAAPTVDSVLDRLRAGLGA
jgi:UDP:flavonoid glycosyltransferase YjiC (YdhE family)